jgi:hypothetical protein
VAVRDVFLSGPLSWLSAAGICWDISGAFFLSKGLLLSDDKLRQQAGTYWGANPSMIRAYCEQRIDTKFGLFQLVGGFFLQLLSAVGIGISGWLFALLTVPICIVWFHYWRNLQFWVVSDSLRLGVGEDSTEKAWKAHFSDIPQPIWDRALRSEKITFAKKKI